MKNLDEFLDAVKEKTGSDYKTAKLLGISDSLIGNWRGNRSIPSNAHIIKMCKFAGLDLGESIIAIEVSREKKAMQREVYKYAGAATAVAGFATAGMMGFIATIMLVITLVVTSPTVKAAPSLNHSVETLYIMLNNMVKL